MILNNIEFQIDRGDRVAFVGQNGQGKSTLVKLVCENLDYTGNLTVGHNVNIGYYAQIQENTLNPEETVFNTIDNIATDEWRNIARIRALLGAFLFGPNDMEKRVKVLSGGEKSRLAIARLLLNPCNLLILDEPTNHLDIASKEILKDALLKYDGTLIVVSHDRDFLQGLTNKTYEFVKNGIKEHLGEINEFLNHHSIETFREFEKAVPTKKAEKKQEKAAKAPEISNEQRKEQEKQLKQIKNRISNCESDIQELENKIKAIEVEMNHPDFYVDTQKSTQVVYEHNTLNQKLSKVISEWEQLLEEVEKYS
jgi:ATP-binding cassette subfamily F protein 3